MNTHSIELDGYYARSRGNSTIYLGTAGSHGNEQLQVTQGKGWEGLTVQVVFHPCKVAVQLPANGVLDVPWEATARPLTALQGRIVFQGFDPDRLVNSTDLAYTVASHSPALGRDEEPYTPGIVECVLNQMDADKAAILQAAQQTGQAKEAAAASAAEAASSAANAQQSAGAANTSAGQAAASASQAAGSAAAANETLTQVQTAGQEAQQKVKDAETEALGNISAAAPALPAVSAAAAWQSVTAKPDGSGYNLAAMAPIEATIRPTVTGNPAVCKDSAAWAFQGLKIYGKSTQDGEPSPENPMPIVSAGDGGSISTSIKTNQLFNKENVKFIRAELKNGVYFFSKDPVLDASISMDNSFINFNKGDKFTVTFKAKSTVDGDRIYYDIYPDEYGDGAYTVLTTEYKECSYTLTTSKAGNSANFRFYSIKTYRNGDISIIPESVMLNRGESVLPWELYRFQSLEISTPNGLPGIPVESGGTFADADGQQWICDVVDFESGALIRHCVTLTFDGSEDENWSFELNTKLGVRYLLPLSFGVMNSDATRGVSSMNSNFLIAKNGGTWDTANVYTVTSGNNHLYCSLNGTESINEFREYLARNPMTLVVGLNHPIKTTLSNEELAAYRSLQTYTGTTVVSTAEPVAGIEASYVMDGNKYRESVDKRLAALEAAQTGI